MQRGVVIEREAQWRGEQAQQEVEQMRPVQQRSCAGTIAGNDIRNPGAVGSNLAGNANEIKRLGDANGSIVDLG